MRNIRDCPIQGDWFSHLVKPKQNAQRADKFASRYRVRGTIRQPRTVRLDTVPDQDCKESQSFQNVQYTNRYIMSYPDLPPMVKTMLADERHRTHHHLWHFVRNRESWNDLPKTAKQQLTDEGWAAPRFDQEPGSGIDFLGMHRQMIEMTDKALANAAVAEWPRIVGWDPILWEDENEDWPVPDWQTQPPSWATEEQWNIFTELALQARSPARIDEMRRIAKVFRDPERLAAMTLDELGIAMEWSIHGWMHMRWSGKPYNDGFSTNPDNDWLFVPWSSHVNKVFWKLHGWIDDRIGGWEAATGQTADLSDTWSGPPSLHPGMPHMAEKELLNNLPAREEEPMPMMVRQHIVEGLLE